MSTAATGPRPLTKAEDEAFKLYLLKEPLETIQQRTRLRPAQIAAAVDLGKLHAKVALEPIAAAPSPSPPRHPSTRPPHDLVEKNRVLTAVVATLREQLAKYEAELAELRAAAATITVAETTEPPVSAAPALAESEEVRAWAVAEGWHVPAEGRLPGGVVAAFIKAKGQAA